MKKLLIGGLVILALGVVMYLGRQPYRNYKQRRFVAQAREFLAKSDYRNAVLSAREALEFNPTSVDACRIIAQIADLYQSPDAVLWRRRVVELRPAVLEYRMDLVQSALLLTDYPNAEQALRSVPEADRHTVAFHSMAAMLAVGEKNYPLAEAHLAEAAKIDPKDLSVKFDLAVIEIQAKNPQLAAQARVTLEQLCSDARCRRDALRHLVMDAMQNHDTTRAETFSQQLEAEKPPMFGDHLLRLGVLKEARSRDFAATLAARENEAAQNPREIQALLRWLLEHKMMDESLRWLLSLPPKTQAEQFTALAIADVYANRGDWAKFQSWLQDTQWPDLEFTRLAMLARAYRSQNQELPAQANWRLAIAAAANRQGPLTVLLRLAEAWKWDREQEETAWLLAGRFPGERWVLELLHRQYTASGNTRGLQRVAEALMKYDANDIVARNNFAADSLLLNLRLPEAYQIARDNYARLGTNVVVASTYAYSLYVQGQTQEGLKILEKFPESQLEQPGVAVYYGTLLAATRQPAKARKYFDIAARSPLLPEERGLIANVRAPN